MADHPQSSFLALAVTLTSGDWNAKPRGLWRDHCPTLVRDMEAETSPHCPERDPESKRVGCWRDTADGKTRRQISGARGRCLGHSRSPRALVFVGRPLLPVATLAQAQAESRVYFSWCIGAFSLHCTTRPATDADRPSVHDDRRSMLEPAGQNLEWSRLQVEVAEEGRNVLGTMTVEARPRLGRLEDEPRQCQPVREGRRHDLSATLLP